MIRIENRCCDCAVPAYPCRGDYCPLTRVAVHYCDECDAELFEIYEVDGAELCEDCLKDKFRRYDIND